MHGSWMQIVFRIRKNVSYDATQYIHNLSCLSTRFYMKYVGMIGSHHGIGSSRVGSQFVELETGPLALERAVISFFFFFLFLLFLAS